MAIQIVCSTCQASYQLRDDLGGKKTRCKCGAIISIPKAAAPPLKAPQNAAPTAPLNQDPLSTNAALDPLAAPLSQQPLSAPQPALGNSATPQSSAQPQAALGGSPLMSKWEQSSQPKSSSGIPRWVIPSGIVAVVLIAGGIAASMFLGGSDTPAENTTADTSDGNSQENSTTSAGNDSAVDGEPESATGNADSSQDDENIVTNSIGMKLATIAPSGGQHVGSETVQQAAFKDETPRNVISFSRPFLMGVHEVTQAQYQNLMEENPSSFEGENRPVDSVTWEDAVAFCEKLSALPEEKAAGRRYRLPTEAEWEVASRAGQGKLLYHFGDDPAVLGEHAWHKANSQNQTHNVGEKTPNPSGLYDMLGNVWEWCADWYSEEYYQQAHDVDPRGPQYGFVKVLRGGGWRSTPPGCRNSFRFYGDPRQQSPLVGFRVVGVSTKSRQLPQTLPAAPTTVLETPTLDDLVKAILNGFATKDSTTPTAIAPSRLDLVRLKHDIFDDEPDRAIAIKNATVFYSDIPDNMQFVSNLIGSEATQHWKINWKMGALDKIVAEVKPGTTGLEHCQMIAVYFRIGDSDSRSFRIILPGAAKFGGNWKFTNHVSHDALSPGGLDGTLEPGELGDLLKKATGIAPPPAITVLDNGLGVHRYDPTAELEIPIDQGHFEMRWMGFNTTSDLLALVYQVLPAAPQGVINSDPREKSNILRRQMLSQPMIVVVIDPKSGKVTSNDTLAIDDRRHAIVVENLVQNRMPIDRLPPDADSQAAARFEWNTTPPPPMSAGSSKPAAGGTKPSPPRTPPTQELIKASPDGEFQVLFRYFKENDNPFMGIRVVDQADNLVSQVKYEWNGTALTFTGLEDTVVATHTEGEFPTVVFTNTGRPLMHSTTDNRFVDLTAPTPKWLTEFAKIKWLHEEKFPAEAVYTRADNGQRHIIRLGRGFQRSLMRIWNSPEGREIFVPTDDLKLYNFTFEDRHSLSPNGAFVAVLHDRELRVWQIFDPLLH